MVNYSFDENGNQLPPKNKTVTEINDYIKWLIDGEKQLQDIYVIGELSNFKKHTSGHCYFSLKDEKSEIRAVMFASYARKLNFKPENGMKIVVHARISVYTQGGSYQLYVDSMQPDGLGSLYLAYEQLKERLNREGLFDEAHKKPIPKFPDRIGVITSPTGAAVRDIINVSKRRYPCVKLLLYPTLVQGPEASNELTKAIEYFNIENNVDVIIIGRGGGSIEDLWAFNDECLARAIYNSKIPVISGVGHEIDFTICDFVADVRAATPSAAAEIATVDINEIINALNTFDFRAKNALMGAVSYYRDKLDGIKSKRIFKMPEIILDAPKMRFSMMVENLKGSMAEINSINRERFANINAKLIALNPMAVLARGYGAIYNQNDEIIKSTKEISVGDNIKVRLHDGSFNASVTEGED
ncbi:MAG: exodeoxyribonuclease VII large subunit [Clostridia bacterium]|nr:exodeoxyribonuclease VII large subunit [Clostridia bacterium]